MKASNGLWAVVFLALAPAPIRALTCVSNLPASNPDSAYTDQGDGTVTDTRTDLMWKRCSEGQGWNGSTCTGTATTHTWQQALQLAAGASYAGHGDWRLPNLKELRSLVEECRNCPAINEAVFPNTPSSEFWSGSPYYYPWEYAWLVHFDNGNNGSYGKSSAYSVRLVRGGN